MMHAFFKQYDYSNDNQIVNISRGRSNKRESVCLTLSKIERVCLSKEYLPCALQHEICGHIQKVLILCKNVHFSHLNPYSSQGDKLHRNNQSFSQIGAPSRNETNLSCKLEMWKEKLMLCWWLLRLPHGLWNFEIWEWYVDFLPPITCF